ncbi:MAG: hypothetical protein Q4C01_01075 [Clostridia bacterium]|nr:hypothetical protein [Clostridia bacterium]
MTKKILIKNLKLPLEADLREYPKIFGRQLSLSEKELAHVRIVRQAIDARDKRDICFSVHIEAEVETAAANRLIARKRAEEAVLESADTLECGTEPQRGRIVVVGLGPCGLFAAWQLAAMGYKPLVIERGKAIEQRIRDVESYWQSGRLNRQSNAAFGEGGAGAFSDGKLTTRIKDGRIGKVLRILAECGAPEEILTLAKPHIGTDLLRITVSNLRKRIESLGGEVRFSTRLKDIRSRYGRIAEIITERDGAEERTECCALLLAIGQGARDTYRMLFDRGLLMQPKPFAIGVRAEHPQSMINRSQYGNFYDHPRLGAASYALTGKSGERGVYTFCMCPGGRVIGSASDEGQIVTNGMSYYARDGVNANAAIVVQVDEKDVGSHPLDGLRFLEDLEHRAFLAGGGEGLAPAGRVEDFLKGRASKAFYSVKPTYLPAVVGADLKRCLPDFVLRGVADGIRSFSRRLKGYDLPDAVLTAIESRTSAPLRIVRDEGMESPNIRGIYPIGEGAGYAGGIVSAAVDGLKAAEKIIEKFKS